MGVDIQTYRARIGTYRHSSGVDVLTLVLVVNFSHGLKAVGSVLFIGLLLVMAGIETNPGPREHDSKSHAISKILVVVLPGNASVDYLRAFFENENGQGGGPVKHVQINEENHSAIVEFEEAESVEKVMQKQPITLEGTELKLSLMAETGATGIIEDEQSNQAGRESVKDLVAKFSKESPAFSVQYSTEPACKQKHNRIKAEIEREAPGNRKPDRSDIGTNPAVCISAPSGVESQDTTEKSPVSVNEKTAITETKRQRSASQARNQTHLEGNTVMTEGNLGKVNEKTAITETKRQHSASQARNQTHLEGNTVMTEGNIEKEVQVTETSTFRQILQKLKLESKYPGQITTRDVVVVDPNEAGEQEKKCTSLADIPWLLLKRLISANSEARNLIALHNDTTESNTDLDNPLSCIFDTPAASQNISPLDVLMVVFQCCDPFLKQIFVQKMYLSKLAVPFIYNHLHNESNQFLLSVWPLRSLTIENKTVSSTNDFRSTEENVLSLKTKVLALARFGRPRCSKSKLLNSLLSGQSCNTFFNIDCPAGMTPRHVSDKQVEIFWLPKVDDKKDRFPDAMTFLNVRGDLNGNFSESLLPSIATLVDAIVIIIDISSVLKQIKDLKAIILQFSSVIIVIANPLQQDVKIPIQRFQSEVLDFKPDIRFRILSTHKGTIEQNVIDMSTSISKHITSQLKSNETIPLQDRLAKAMSNKIPTDEDEAHFKQGKEEAQRLLDRMRNDGQPSQWRELLSPVHSKYSQTLGELIKARERVKSESEGERINDEIKTVRENQTKAITETVRVFIDILTRNQEHYLKLKLFLCWLHFYIEREKRQIMPQFMYESRSAWKKLKHLKSKKTQVASEIAKQRDVIKDLESKIDKATFTIHHLFREVGHVYDAILEMDENASKFRLPPLEQIAKIVGRLVADGHQLDLIDGESFYMPRKWTENVLQQVEGFIDTSKVMTLSVLGLQSSGKSTLLNTMFGSQFSTRTGRCTRGVHVQLIPAKITRLKDVSSQFNYVLVVDTEGLRSPELGHQPEHDNELATVITGIGDITILNIMGENTSEIRDILQVIVHAFLRLKQTNTHLDIRKSCAFIHQNVTDTSASENMMSGLSKLMQTLDEMTKESARSEKILDISTFNQVIEFDINSQVWYLKNLWQGNPPMARVNNEFSERIVDVKCKIIQKALQIKHKSYKSLNDVLEHAYSLWKGVLNEDFVFSFRNSLEIRAYMKMEKIVQDKLWKLESFIHDKLIGATQCKFADCDQTQNLQGVSNKLVQELNDVLTCEKRKTEEDIKLFFANNKYKDIVIQWQHSQQHRINSLCFKLEQVIREQVEKSLQKRSVEIITLKSHKIHEEELRKRSMKVVNENKGKKLSPNEIDELFSDIWTSFLSNVSSTQTASDENRENMQTVFETCLQKDIFAQNHSAIKKGLEESLSLSPIQGLKELAGTFHLTRIDITDISFSNWSEIKNYFNKFKRKTMVYVTGRVNQLFETVDANIKRLCQVSDEILEMDVTEMMRELNTSIYDILSGKNDYEFKDSFYVKVNIHVSRHAHAVFEKHNEDYFNKRSTEARLEQYKQQQKISFEAHLSNRQSEDLVANLFSLVIEGFAEEWTSQNLPNKVTDELHSILPSVKNRVIIEICTNLLDKGNFGDFILYLESPKEYAYRWVTKNSNDHLFDKESCAYANIVKALLNRVYGSVKTCVCKLQSTYTRKPSPSTYEWIEEFQAALKSEHFFISAESFRNVINAVQNIENVENLTTRIDGYLTESQNKLTIKFSQHNSASVQWAVTNPIDRMTKKIWGCPEQCAFCSEPCAKTEDHADSFHYSIQHRPKCCKGIRRTETEMASITSCDFDIQSDTTHTCGVFSYICNNGTREACGKTHHYREYKNYLPQWDIPPTSNMHDTSKFWMWFVATYKDDLQKYYNYKVDNIPPSWNKITKKQARKSLEKTYSA